MSATKHETNRPSVDHDIEIRIRNFGNFTIAALSNSTILIVLVGMLWFWIKAVSSTIPMPFPLRWACILYLCLYTMARNAWLFPRIIALKRIHMSEIEDENRSRNRDLGTCTTNLEDWILANFCVIVGLSTIGFVARYWIEVIALTTRSFFYWTCTMGGLCSLFWLLRRTIRFYREVKGVKYEEAWGILVGVNALRVYNKFEGLNARGVLGEFLDACRLLFQALKFPLDIVGFHIGRGLLFDRLPDEWKTARRGCKTRGDVANFFAVFAGGSNQEDDNKEDTQDRNHVEEACFPPSVFEWQPNPVILHHLRGEHLQSLHSGPSVAKNTSECHLMDTAGAAGRVCPDMAVDFDDKGTAKNNQKSPDAPRHTGPTTMPTNLSSFACPQCTYLAKRKFELNKHVNQTHNHRFKCVYHGCGKTFGFRTNLERHEATHTQRKGFKCPNSWCKTSERIFTRKDNLKRHEKLCVTSK